MVEVKTEVEENIVRWRKIAKRSKDIKEEEEQIMKVEEYMDKLQDFMEEVGGQNGRGEVNREKEAKNNRGVG